MFGFLIRIFSWLTFIIRKCINWKSYKYPTINEKQEMAKSRIEKYALVQNIPIRPLVKNKKISPKKPPINNPKKNTLSEDIKQDEIARGWMAW